MVQTYERSQRINLPMVPQLMFPGLVSPQYEHFAIISGEVCKHLKKFFFLIYGCISPVYQPSLWVAQIILKLFHPHYMSFKINSVVLTSKSMGSTKFLTRAKVLFNFSVGQVSSYSKVTSHGKNHFTLKKSGREKYPPDGKAKCFKRTRFSLSYGHMDKHVIGNLLTAQPRVRSVLENLSPPL